MRDDFLGAEWSANRHHFNAALHKLFDTFIGSMEALSRQQFDAPWRGRSDRNLRLHRSH